MMIKRPGERQWRQRNILTDTCMAMTMRMPLTLAVAGVPAIGPRAPRLPSIPFAA
jgi:hypothetical protein